jgi:16S rRNA (guanine966-N2)-methyltransferase
MRRPGARAGAYPTTLARREEMARHSKGMGKPGQLRIIGGRWRGRKLAFPAEPGLRPTTDRIRETLFNWLAPQLQGARCADLFAGSGALGLEALSRGASHCDFIEQSPVALAQLREHLHTLQASTSGYCHGGSALHFLDAARQPYDIVFIDPPFGQSLVEPACNALVNRHLLNPQAMVYIETAATEPAPKIPGDWLAHREKTAGGVTYRLYIAQGSAGR